MVGDERFNSVRPHWVFVDLLIERVKMPQKQFEEVCSCVGKTIKQVETGSCADYLIIIFEDNTYTSIEPVHVYEDLILESRKLDIVECADKNLVELGIFSEKELNEYIKETDEENCKMIEHREKEMLAYLKGKYENGLGS